MDRARQEQGEGGDRPAVPTNLQRRPTSRADGATGPGSQRTRGSCAGTVVHPGPSFASCALPDSDARAHINRLPHADPQTGARTCAQPGRGRAARPEPRIGRGRVSSDRQPSRRVVLSEAGTEGGGRARAAPCALAVGRRRDLRAGRNSPRHRARCDPWLPGRAPRRSPEPRSGRRTRSRTASTTSSRSERRTRRCSPASRSRRPIGPSTSGSSPPRRPTARAPTTTAAHRASRTRSASTTRPG